VRVELHGWDGKLGTIELVNGVAVPDERARPFLDDAWIVEPDTLVTLTYADGARYLRALPANINGDAMLAVMVGEGGTPPSRAAPRTEKDRQREAGGKHGRGIAPGDSPGAIGEGRVRDLVGKAISMDRTSTTYEKAKAVVEAADADPPTRSTSASNAVTDKPLEPVEFEADADGTVATEIPDLPLYVVGRNTLFSGWGPAGDRTVYDVFPCESREQADLVARTARDPLIKLGNVRIVEKAPSPGPDRVLVIRSPARVEDWADMATFDDL
jgi:hypothetical protein